ncbi:hypothetical protein ABID22_002725 [Pontibacter aydingkolensis]|uniref:6-bladed beta-propeller protein n=1 Tax=Pontibacter aydingkolensis TaxID=1911536 RepID=A0ABS7CX01_9BACT|nr:hypothetical protein [Pontibacter aydingkolensis]MBW7468315.1 hypothetical protein [Pontibacter aydingkolensis]
MKQNFLTILLLLSLLAYTGKTSAQSRTRASTAFTYLPEKGEYQYNQRIAHKTIPVSQSEFIILSRQEVNSYAVEKYNAELKKGWQTTIPLNQTETVEAFFKSADAAIVITLRTNEATQQLFGHRINLQSGQKHEPVLLLEAPLKGRRAGIAASADGSKLLAYRYHTDNNHQIKDISSILYDSNFQKVAETKYNLSDVPGILTADIKLSNSGEQYVCLISEEMNRLTVRQYTPGIKTAKVMSVLVGGVYDGIKVYIMDSKFELMPDNNTLYGAVMIAEEATGKYYSLKTVKFDFEADDMVFAEEFRFTQAYVDKVTAFDKSSSATRLEDIYLSDILLSSENNLTIIAEKKYTEGGENAPYFAKELHLFAYDEYMTTTWSSVLLKHQQAPADEAFSGISYSAYVSGNNIHLLTLEELKGKHDLYLRQIDTKTGKTTAPKTVGLKMADDMNLAYVKDFTAWLTDKNIITVVRPSKKASGLQLSHIYLR